MYQKYYRLQCYVNPHANAESEDEQDLNNDSDADVYDPGKDYGNIDYNVM